MGLVIFYIINIVKRKGINNNDKTMWIVLVIFTTSIGMLIYYFKFIWKDNIEIKSHSNYIEKGPLNQN